MVIGVYGCAIAGAANIFDQAITRGTNQGAGIWLEFGLIGKVTLADGFAAARICVIDRIIAIWEF